MSEAVIITVISVIGALMTGVWVELIRARRQSQVVTTGTATIVHEVTENGGKSIKDTVTEIRTDVREIRKEQIEQGKKIAALEAKTGG